MEIKSIKCPECGASFEGNLLFDEKLNVSFGVCTHCNTRFALESNNLENAKEIVVEEPKEEPKKEPKKEEPIAKKDEVIENKEEKPLFSFKENICSAFKNHNIKKRVMAFAAAVTMAVTLFTTKLANHDDYVERDYDFILSTTNEIKNKLYDGEITIGEAEKAWKEIGIDINPEYLDTLQREYEEVKRHDLTREEEEEVRRQVHELRQAELQEKLEEDQLINEKSISIRK